MGPHVPFLACYENIAGLHAFKLSRVGNIYFHVLFAKVSLDCGVALFISVDKLGHSSACLEELFEGRLLTVAAQDLTVDV